MRIVRLVTRKAVLRCRLQLNDRRRIYMTLRTGKLRMLSIQSKTEQVVIEVITIRVQAVMAVEA